MVGEDTTTFHYLPEHNKKVRAWVTESKESIPSQYVLTDCGADGHEVGKGRREKQDNESIPNLMKCSDLWVR